MNDDGFGPRRRLSDSAELRAVLHQEGAELVLHGHGHRTLIAEIPGPSHTVPVVGVRSSSHTGVPENRRAQYHLFRIESAGTGSGDRRFRVSLSTRGYDEASGGFVAEGERAL